MESFGGGVDTCTGFVDAQTSFNVEVQMLNPLASEVFEILCCRHRQSAFVDFLNQELQLSILSMNGSVRFLHEASRSASGDPRVVPLGTIVTRVRKSESQNAEAFFTNEMNVLGASRLKAAIESFLGRASLGAGLLPFVKAVAEITPEEALTVRFRQFTAICVVSGVSPPAVVGNHLQASSTWNKSMETALSEILEFGSPRSRFPVAIKNPNRARATQRHFMSWVPL